MPLTDNQIKGLKPAANPYKKTDRDNLRVLVSPAGGKSFQTRYQFDGKEKTITHGRYPAMRLAEARALNEQTHFLVAKGIDPMAKAAPRDERAARAKAASPKVRAVPATASGVDRERLLATVADEWWDRKKLPTLSPKNAGRVRTRVFDYFVAPLADRSVDDIEPREILAVIRQVESDHGIATAKRVYGFAKQIFAWAKVTRELAVNPALDLEDGLSATPKDKPLPYLKIEEVADFYAALRNNRGRNDVSSIALELYMHTVLRNSELRWARWENVRDDRLLIPEGGMKRVRDESLAHIVPLSTHSLALLKRLRGITGDSEWLFPKFKQGSSPGGDPVISDATVAALIEAIGYKGRVGTHGWKKTFSTLANESGLWNSDWIEFQLAHHRRGSVRSVYNKATYLPHRHKLMQWWSDQLSEQERIANDRMALEDDLSDILG